MRTGAILAALPVLAALILLFVLAGRRSFVFYEDRRDALQSSLPAVVILAAVAASVLAGAARDRHTPVHHLIWAGAGSLVLLLCIDPVQKAIERSNSVFLGSLIGITKILVPFTGVSMFLLKIRALQLKPEGGDDRRANIIDRRFIVNCVGLFWDVGLLALTILINGSRFPPAPATCDPYDIRGRRASGYSSSGDTSRFKRDSVVVIFVLAVHVLCGVVLVKA